MALPPPFRRPKRPDDDDLDDLVDARMVAAPKRPTTLAPQQPKAPMPVQQRGVRPAPPGNRRDDDTSLPPASGAGLPPPDPRLAVGGLDGGKGKTVKSPGGIGGTTTRDPGWAASDTRGDDLDPLVEARMKQDAERKAAADELARGKAQALAGGAAKAGLGGFGLSGGSAAMASDIGRAQDRTAVTTLGDLDKKNRDEDFQAIQRRAALDDLEDAANKDFDGDGFVDGEAVDGNVGNGDPGAATPGNDKAEQAALEKQWSKAPISEWGAFPGDDNVGEVVVDGAEYDVFQNAEGEFYRVKKG